MCLGEEGAKAIDTKVHSSVLLCTAEWNFEILSESWTQFEGTYEHKLDKKLRVSVPSCWRPAAGGSYSLRLLRWEIEGIPVIKALTDEAFQAALESIQESDLSAGMKSRQKAVLYTHNQPVSVNEQGKLLIPKKFAEERGLQAEETLYFLGRGNYFELMSPVHYESFMKQEQEILTSLYDTLDFG